jgi:hypothetical protein
MRISIKKTEDLARPDPQMKDTKRQINRVNKIINGKLHINKKN